MEDKELDNIFLELLKMQEQKPEEKTVEKSAFEKCKHINTHNDYCIDCGLVISHKLVAEESRNFSSEDPFKKEQIRCHYKKNEEKNIFTHLKKIKLRDFTDSDIIECNIVFQVNFKDEIHRGQKLLGIVYAIVYNYLMKSKKPSTPEEIYKCLNIDNKTATTGIKEYARVMMKNGKKNIPRSAEVEHYIETYVRKCNMRTSEEDIKKDIYQVTELYKQIKDKSKTINSSTPISVCLSIIFYYYNKIGMNIKISDYKNAMDLSDITISKIDNKISMIVKS